VHDAYLVAVRLLDLVDGRTRLLAERAGVLVRLHDRDERGRVTDRRRVVDGHRVGLGRIGLRALRTLRARVASTDAALLDVLEALVDGRQLVEDRLVVLLAGRQRSDA